MVHSMSYFVYDTLIEVYYNTADTLTNMHHAIVLVGTYFHLRSSYSGYDYLLMHLCAEISNPFVIIRTILKFLDKKDTFLYSFSENMFAVTFIILRLFATPVLMIFLYESENCLYSTKIGISLVLFI
jgi:hypothetical protein